MLVIGALSAGASAQEASLSSIEVRSDGLRPGQASSASKSATPIERLPRSVSVVTETEIKARDAQSLMEALAYTPGVYGGGYGSASLSREYPLVRGFLAYQFLDGLKLHDSNRAEEPYGLERVELLRGPASSLYGQGSPGGLINLRSKRPTAETVREIGVRVGSQGLRQGQFDLGGALNADASLQYRMTGMVRKSDGEIDYTEADRRYFAGAMAWKPNAATSLTLMASRQDDPSLTAHQPLPRAGTLEPGVNGRVISRNLFLGEPSRHDSHKESWRVGYEFTHRFNDVWSIEQNAAYKKGDVHVDEVQARGIASGSTRWVRQLFAADYSIVTKQVDTRLVGQIDAAGLKHRVLLGYDFASVPNTQATGTNRASTYLLDLYDPVYGQATPANPITSNRTQQLRQGGFYLQDQVEWGRWSVLAGLRRDRAVLDQKTAVLNPVTGLFSDPPYVLKRDMATTGQLGVAYELGGGWSPYLNYAESFAPVTGSTAAGLPFEPTQGRQVEAGIKWVPAGRALMGSASIYQIKQRNVLGPDLANPGFAAQTGEVRSRGGEIELKAGLAPGLDLTASYAYTDAIVTATTVVNGLDKHPVGIPRQTASAWLSYRVGGVAALQGMTLSAGVHHVGESWGDSLNTFDVPAVTLVDLGLRWNLVNLSPALKGWDTSLVVKNVANRRYVANCDNALNCYYGVGRRVALTASASF
ncbi:TonB-dependent siderophore receptor [Variovorax boronicumulans]|uniref:TonB-dependent siderophore receptor n=1 Tax=Variovorax boronicumulans TaxID=436515 RepID=UPI001C561F07